MAQARSDGRTGPQGRVRETYFAHLQASESFLAECRDERPAARQIGTIHCSPARTAPRTPLPDRAAAARRRVSAFAALALGDDAVRCEAAAWRALDETGDVQALAETLFAPAARLIGKRWCDDAVSFVGVTLAVSRMQRLFRAMAVRSPDKTVAGHGGSILLAPMPGEQHGFGLAIAEDAFHRAGWQVEGCEGDDPGQPFRQASAVRHDIVGLSIGAQRLLPALASTIGRLRSVSRNRSVVIAVGGSLAAAMPDAVAAAGADIVAVDLESALAACRRVLETPDEIGHRSMAAE